LEEGSRELALPVALLALDESGLPNATHATQN
jgi:hypothetical protein